MIPEESVIEEETKSMAPTDLDNISDRCPSEEAPNRFDVIDLS